MGYAMKDRSQNVSQYRESAWYRKPVILASVKYYIRSVLWYSIDVC
jgi:hypothetical protein